MADNETKAAAAAIETKADAAAPVEAAVQKTDTTTAKAAAPAEAKSTPEAKAVESDAKPAEELKSLLDEAGDEEEKEAVPEKVVPEKYGEFKLAEGISISEEAMKLVEPVFKQLGLSQDEAQALVDLQTKIVKEREDAHVAAFGKYLEEQKKESVTFFGPKLKETMANVARARDKFMHKELQDKFNITGLSNDKDVLIFLDKLGRVIGEGKFVEGKASAGSDAPGTGAGLDKVYPSMAKK